MNKYVLIIDDEEAQANIIANILEKEGFSVDKAYSAEEALKSNGKAKYSVMLVDLKMPGMGGLAFLKQIKEKDLGMSVIISGVLSEVIPACKEAGVTPHSINYSLGVWGKKDKLPDEDTLAITTMCGHHMIPPKFVDYVKRRVKKNKITPEEGAKMLAEFCYCGIFNHIRCADIFKEKLAAEQSEEQETTG